MSDYDATFEKRGREYEYAVTMYPGALVAEFRVAADYIIKNIPALGVVINIPAACVPLRKYLPPDITYIEYESNMSFAKQTGIQWASLFSFPLSDCCVDCVICLASLHHASAVERSAFYTECLRILRPGGVLIVGDVVSGTAQDDMLNTFVNAHNSAGHVGLFWSAADKRNFLEAGFDSVEFSIENYNWGFASENDMVDFCTHLFGLDLASPATVLRGLEMYLNPIVCNNGSLALPWSLGYFVARKPLMP
jgi:SAM-dependent methyltransferase